MSRATIDREDLPTPSRLYNLRVIIIIACGACNSSSGMFSDFYVLPAAGWMPCQKQKLKHNFEHRIEGVSPRLHYPLFEVQWEFTSAYAD